MSSGTTAERALLLTDIVDSTRLVQELGDARSAELFARHDRLARDLLEPHGGLEIDRTDGFLLLFPEAGAGLAYALAYHRALRALSLESGLELRARAGLHQGSVVLRRNSPEDVSRGAKPLEVEGIAKPTAARIMSLATGDQVLLSAEAHAVVAPGLAPGLLCLSHGHYRLKGVAEPVEIFEVGSPELAPLAPPPDSAKVYRVLRSGQAWVPRRELPNRLPREARSFHGRDPELRTLADALEGRERLLTLTGVGGLGKTALAVHFARSYLGSFPGGAWFCEAGGLQDAAGLCGALAQVLDLSLTEGDPVARLADALLGRGAVLVILDELSLPADELARCLGAWLRRAPEARFLLTRLSPIGLPAERVLPLPPLPVPLDGNAPLADLARSPSLALFLERARAVRPDFSLRPDNAADIATLVRELDGLPLAIELAAARVRMMPPRKLLERLNRRFDLLSGGRDKRATLRGVIDESWEQLEAWEQLALAQCSVFVGGWSLEAAEEVLDLEPWDAWPMDVLEALCVKSLVRTWTLEEPVGEVRFALFHSIRDYAAERLDDPEAIGLRHGAFYARAGEAEAIEALDRQEGRGRRALLALELGNLEAATEAGLRNGEEFVATGASLAASQVLRLRGPGSRALELNDRVLPEVRDPELRRRLLYEGAVLRSGSDPDLAEGAAREGLELALAARDEGARGELLGVLANVQLRRGQVAEAEASFAEALAVLGTRHPRRAAVVHGNLAILQLRRGQGVEALASFERSLQLHRRAGSMRSEGVVLGNLATLHRRQGRLAVAREMFQEALGIHRAFGNRPHEGAVLGSLALLLQEEGAVGEARRCLEEAVALQRQLGNRRGEGFALGNLGDLLVRQGEVEAGIEQLDRAIAIVREAGIPLAEGSFLAVRAHAECRLGAVERSWERIQIAVTLLREASDTLELATALCRKGFIELARDDPDGAARSLEEARSLAPSVGPESFHGSLMAELRQALP